MSAAMTCTRLSKAAVASQPPAAAETEATAISVTIWRVRDCTDLPFDLPILSHPDRPRTANLISP